MKNIIFIVLFLLLPISAYSHPGKTDYRGGHKCWKNCSEWELRYGEYHLHDDDWRPIRLDSRGYPIEPARLMLSKTTEQVEASGLTEVHSVATTGKPADIKVSVHNYSMAIHEESILPFNILLLIILALLLLMMLIFIKRKQQRK